MYILLKWRLGIHDLKTTLVVFFWWDYLLWCEQYSFGFSRFRPCGASVRRVWVHLDSTLWRIVIACGLLGVFLMNSRTVIWMSSFLLCPIFVKWAATGLFGSPLLMSPKCPTNLSFRRSSVCPTYCMPHLWQVMAYTRLELLQDTFLIAGCVRSVVVLVILPDLFR